MSDLISVIVPIFNAEPYLDRCITSILCQSYVELELILIDDGSEDNSLSICRQFQQDDSRIIVAHQENQGVSNARNTGIRLAKGDYITFVDSDDSLIPEALESALCILQNNHADAVIYGWKVILESDESCEKKSSDFEISEDIPYVIHSILEHYSAYGGGYPWNKLWRRDAVQKDGQIPMFKSELYYFEDLEWVVRMLMNVQRVVVCPHCFYLYNIRENSVTHSVNQSERREIGYHRAVEEIIRDLVKWPALQHWFSEKYYPEIVNGVINAKRKKWNILEKYLYNRMDQIKSEIIHSKSIPLKIKLRCWLLWVLR